MALSIHQLHLGVLGFEPRVNNWEAQKLPLVPPPCNAGTPFRSTAVPVRNRTRCFVILNAAQVFLKPYTDDSEPGKKPKIPESSHQLFLWLPKFAVFCQVGCDTQSLGLLTAYCKSVKLLRNGSTLIGYFWICASYRVKNQVKCCYFYCALFYRPFSAACPNRTMKQKMLYDGSDGLRLGLTSRYLALGYNFLCLEHPFRAWSINEELRSWGRHEPSH